MSRRQLLASVLEKTKFGTLLSKTIGNWQGLLVLNYHRVGDETQSHLDRGVFSARADQFEQQVRFLKKNCDVIRDSELDQTIRRPGRFVMLTFDDGYRDNYEIAFPILQQHQVPATFFLTTGFLDDGLLAWWDEIAWMVHTSQLDSINPNLRIAHRSLESEKKRQLVINDLLNLYKSTHLDDVNTLLDEIARSTQTGRAPKSLSKDLWMTWDMVTEMSQAGMQFGGHTITHPVLSQASAEQQRHEIFASKSRIESMIGQKINSFSYPVGQHDSFSPLTQALIQEAGYQWGFSFFGGYATDPAADPFNIPRVAVAPQLSQDLFQSMTRLPKIFA